MYKLKGWLPQAWSSNLIQSHWCWQTECRSGTTDLSSSAACRHAETAQRGLTSQQGVEPGRAGLVESTCRLTGWTSSRGHPKAPVRQDTCTPRSSESSLRSMSGHLIGPALPTRRFQGQRRPAPSVAELPLELRRRQGQSRDERGCGESVARKAPLMASEKGNLCELPVSAELLTRAVMSPKNTVVRHQRGRRGPDHRAACAAARRCMFLMILQWQMFPWTGERSLSASRKRSRLKGHLLQPS
mmetsp:Transcript_75347/g.179039  ORF Transcript_75347/g.179039 Transcript_75347/m.179039 type:complete len:243 (+) Transcript_75347:489-1217(+)